MVDDSYFQPIVFCLNSRFERNFIIPFTVTGLGLISEFEQIESNNFKLLSSFFEILDAANSSVHPIPLVSMLFAFPRRTDEASTVYLSVATKRGFDGRF